MADGKIELAKAYVQIIPTTKGIKNALMQELSGNSAIAGENAGKVMGAGLLKGLASLGIGTALGKVIADSFSEGAAIEQSLGGVETLFKDSANTVIANAETAYKRAGVNANRYMEQVTSFSASLLQSVGGDTEAAAKTADLAIVDMSDNAAKFGSDVQSIQDAYQGFAKQNYTMLDNLKLGYGGTKTEMERLLEDAEKLSGQEYDISNLNDVYNAIHEIQESLGVAGTTSKEAAETLSGSFGMAKASVQNFEAVLANGGDASKAFDDMTESVEVLIENIVRMGSTFARQVGSLTYEKFIGEASTATQAVELLALTVGSVVAMQKAAAAQEALIAKKKTITASLEYAKAAAVGVTNSQLSTQELLAHGAAVKTGAAAAQMVGYAAVIAATAIVAKTLANALDEARGEDYTSHDPFDDLTESLQAMSKEQEKTAKAFSETKDAMEKSYSEADTHAESCTALAKRLDELNSVQNRTTEEQAEYESVIQSLNDEMPGLNLELDEQTGNLKQSNSEIKKIIENTEKRAKAEAAQEHLIDLYNEQLKAQTEYNKALEHRNSLESIGMDTQTDAMAQANTDLVTAKGMLDSVNSSLETARGYIADAAGTTSATNGAVSASASQVAQLGKMTSLASADMKELAETYDKAALSVGGTTEILSVDTAEQIQKISGEYQTMLADTKQTIFDSVNWFEQVPETATVSAQDLKNNMAANLDYLGTWSDGISTLAKKGIDDGLLAELRDMGAASLPYVQALNSMSEPELKKYSDQWVEAGKLSEQAAEGSLVNIKEKAAGEIQNIRENNEHQATTIKESFKYLGEMAVQGFNEGLAQNDIIDDTARYTINSAYDAMAYEAKIRSPSRRAIELAEYIPQGLAIGILNGAGEVTAAAKTVMGDVFGEYKKDMGLRPVIWTPPKDSEVFSSDEPQGFHAAERQGFRAADAKNITLTLSDSAGDVIAKATAAANDLFSGSRAALAERGVAY